MKLLDSYFVLLCGLTSVDGAYPLHGSSIVTMLLFLGPFLARVAAPWYYVIAHSVH